jgi:putative transposase
LAPTPEQAAGIDATLVAFAGACDLAAETARAIDSTNKFKVHHACYATIREQFGLSANLAIRAIARACAAFQTAKKMQSTFAPTSIDYDVRIFGFQEGNWTFSLRLLAGRVRLATVLGEWQRASLKGRKPASATLVKRADGRYFLHVQVVEEVPDPVEPTDYLGVDLGLVNIAVDSEGEAYSGAPINRDRRRRATARKQYQRKGSKRAKRKLKAMAGRQRRYQAAVNHTISKELVGKAKALGVGIAMEDLSGIRDRVEPTVSMAFRRRFGNWGFHQLRTFVEYKADSAGVAIVFVDPAYTSQTCNRCGQRDPANRKSQAGFRCTHCGYSTNADFNAALNLRAKAIGTPRKPSPKVATLRG